MKKIVIPVEQIPGSAMPGYKMPDWYSQSIDGVRMPDIIPTITIKSYDAEYMQQFINAFRAGEEQTFSAPNGARFTGTVISVNEIYSFIDDDPVLYECEIRLNVTRSVS